MADHLSSLNKLKEAMDQQAKAMSGLTILVKILIWLVIVHGLGVVFQAYKLIKSIF